MLVTKTSPVGIDYSLQLLQTELHDRLLTTWGIDTSTYKAYGRCYRKPADAGYIVANYDSGTEYTSLFDDTLKAMSFFGQSPATRLDQKESTEVHLVFFVNLALLKPSIAHRADEEVRKDVISIFAPALYGFAYQGFDITIESALREYRGNWKKTLDMHPFHCFRINLKVLYDINSNNCTPFKN